MSEFLHCPLLLAIELGDAAPPPVAMTLATEEVAGLVDRVAVDLARLVPGIEQLGLVVCAALLDPAQVLRPGWPVFAELALQYERHARGKTDPQLVGLGAASGRMASPLLEPEAGLGRGPLLVLPLLLIGSAEAAAAAGQRLEAVLESEGLAGADTSWYLGRALSTSIEHARYLTHHDLCALTQIQLEHAGFAAGWQLIEAALLTPERAEQATSDGGVALRWHDGEATIGICSFAGHARAALHAGQQDEELIGAFVLRKREERVLEALLRAHGLALRTVRLHAPSADPGAVFDQATAFSEPYFIEALAAPMAGDSTQIVVHEHPELGSVALSVVESGSAGWRELAHAYPLGRSGLRELRAELRRRYSCDGAELRLGRIGLRDDLLDLSALAGLEAPPIH